MKQPAYKRVLNKVMTVKIRNHNAADASPRREKTGPQTGSDLNATGITDQHGEKWIKVTLRCSSAIIRQASFFSPDCFKQLRGLGVAISNSSRQAKLKAMVDDIEDWSETLTIAAAPGWHGDVYLLQDGRVVAPDNSAPIHVSFAGSPLENSVKGTFKGWKKTVVRFGLGQELLTFGLCVPLAGMILSVGPRGITNPVVQFYGPRAIGKTTAADFAMSALGAPSNLAGSAAKTWKTTDNGLEEHFPARADGFLMLDDATLQGVGSDVGNKIADIVVMLAAGLHKNRFNEPAPDPIRFSVLSTANKPLFDQVQNADSDKAEAALVRLLDIPADAGAGMGVWSRPLPKGCKTPAQASQALGEAVGRHYGHAGPAFAEKLVTDRSRDGKKLRKKIKRYIDDFVECALALPGAEERTARIYGVVYAAGKLAKGYDVLPLKNLKTAALNCYRRALEARTGPPAQLSTIDRIRNYITSRKGELLELDGHACLRLTNGELDQHPGFLKTLDGRRCLLVRKARLRDVLADPSKEVLRELKKRGLLHAPDGMQAQAKVRKSTDKDRLYAFRLGGPLLQN